MPPGTRGATSKAPELIKSVVYPIPRQSRLTRLTKPGGHGGRRRSVAGDRSAVAERVSQIVSRPPGSIIIEHGFFPIDYVDGACHAVLIVPSEIDRYTGRRCHQIQHSGGYHEFEGGARVA